MFTLNILTNRLTHLWVAEKRAYHEHERFRSNTKNKKQCKNIPEISITEQATSGTDGAQE
jgi:hypothetical protein